MNSATRTISVCLVFALAPSSAFCIEINFNSASDISLFNVPTPITWNSNAGVGGTGGLSVTGTHTGTYAPESFDFTELGSVIDISMFFRAKDPGGHPATYGELYLVGEPDEYNTFFTNAVEASIRENSTSVTISGIFSLESGSGSGFSVSFPKGTVQPERWYEIKSRIENIGQIDLNWHIEVNDYGAGGQQFLGTVAETTQQRQDFFGLLDDETLYAGFNTSTSGATASDNFAVSRSVTPIQTTVVEIAPTFDVEYESGAIVTITEGAEGIRIGEDAGAPGNPVSGALYEFPVGSLPDDARIVDATLVLSPNVALNTPRLHVLGYEGDGLASISDATAFGLTLQSSYDVDVFADVEIPLDAVNVQPQVDSASHLGIRVSSLTPVNSLIVNSLEAPFTLVDTVLRLEYFVPGFPGDFDGDGDVDGNDLLFWQRDPSVGSLAAWESNYGTLPTSLAASTSVPEPSTLLLLLVNGMIAAYRRPQV